MKKLLLLLLLPAVCTAEELRLSASDEEQTELALTIYNNFALVREHREILLPEGRFQLEFEGVATTIDPTSVAIESEALDVIEQSYRYDLLNKQTLLERFVGRKLKYTRTVLEGARFETLLREGTLLSINPEVVQFGDEIEIDPEGTISLAYLPDDLKTSPTLRWTLNNKSTGSHGLQVSYIANQIGWQTDYVLNLDDREQRAGLVGWVSLRNDSGARFRKASIQLVAGEVNRQAPQVRHARALQAMSMEQADALPTRQTLSDYHLYTLKEPVGLDGHAVKQVRLLQADGIKISKNYVVESQVQTYQMQNEEPAGVAVVYSFANNGPVNQPLPAGRYRVYKSDRGGNKQFIGEDRESHTPVKGTVELSTGRAFDIRARRKQTSFRRLSDKMIEVAYEITLDNQTDKSVAVEVRENLQGSWSIVEESLKGEKLNATTYVFTLKPGKGRSASVSYTARFSF